MNTYERVASILRYLDERHLEQPDLDAVARHVGATRFAVHRLFQDFAGVTPKDFLQCLTLEHAKRLLREGASVLDAALDVGLSGPSRLHDLCIGIEAATPGEWKAKGDGLTIHAGFAETPFGLALIGETSRGVCHLSFVESRSRRDDPGVESFRSDWPRARIEWDDEAAERISKIVFAKEPAHGKRGLRAHVRGTPFQVRVWRALLAVPRGALVTYGRLARAIGEPTAARAIGTAVGSNSIAVLIPCHRVIRETGALGDYRWSRERKQAIIGWESARATTGSAVVELERGR